MRQRRESIGAVESKMAKRRSKASRQTLENPLLYSNFLKELRRLDRNFDTEIIDRSLTPEEAWRELRERHHLGRSKDKEPNYVDEMRDVLHEIGIKHPRLQSFIIKEMDANPEKRKEDDGELISAAYILQMRPLHNIRTDLGIKAKPCKTLAQWVNRANRCDIEGVDSKSAKFVADWFGRED